jgi:hypothetical protein
MNEKEFVIWLKGFVTACNSYLPTPAQWDELVDTLNKVDTNSIKKGIFDKESKGVFDIGTIDVPKNYWQTERVLHQTPKKELLND